MSPHEANRARKWRRCLRCGKAMWTDRCHRICRACHRRVDAEPCPAGAPAAAVHPQWVQLRDELRQLDA